MIRIIELVINLCIGCLTIFVMCKIYEITKLDIITKFKIDFYNKAYYDWLDNTVRICPSDINNYNKIIKTAKYIERNRNICESDGIWKKISNSVCYFSFELSDYDYKIIECDDWEKINQLQLLIENELHKMKEKYEKQYLNLENSKGKCF